MIKLIKLISSAAQIGGMVTLFSSHLRGRLFRHKDGSSRSMARKPVLPLSLAVVFALGGCGGGSGGATAPVVLPILTVTNASVIEGNAGISNLVFTVTSNTAATSAIAVTYATADGTALAGQDYTATNGILNIAVGATSGTVTVPVSGDTVIEPDETLTLALTAPANATIATAAITGTITNDDFPTVSIADVSVFEGSTLGTTNMDFTATLSAASPVDVTVVYATADGTALSASDYTVANATLTIAAGATTGIITVLVGADQTTFEPNETLTLTLSNPAGATLGTAVATGTILNDDAGGLNDTGITQWGHATVNNLTVTQPLFPVQDADIGRDANPATNSNADGKGGFSFAKLDAAGQPLADQAAVYATTQWSCVQDQITGLTWEVKTTAAAGGLRDASWTYSWFNSTGVNDGGVAGTASGGTCVDGVAGLGCDTEKYVAAINALTGANRLCGFTDWRLPRVGELYSIVDQSIAAPAPAIDTGYFPNTIANSYWPSSSTALNTTNTWLVGFGFGGSNGIASKLLNNHHVRLVRGGL